MKPKYCCNTRLTDYYTQQAGSGGFPIYTGSRYQRGSGLGSVFGSIGRRILLFLMNGVKVVGKEALRSGMNVAADALAGRNINEAFRERAAESRDILKEKATRKLRELGNQVGKEKKKRRKLNIFD